MREVAAEPEPKIARPAHLAKLEAQARKLLEEGPSQSDVARVHDFYYLEDEGLNAGEVNVANEERAQSFHDERVAPRYETLERAIRVEHSRPLPPQIMFARQPRRRAASARRSRRVTAAATARGAPTRLEDDPGPLSSKFGENEQLRLELEPAGHDAPPRRDPVAELAIARAAERQLERRLAFASENRRRWEDRLLIEQAVEFVGVHPGCSGRRVRAVLGGSNARAVAALHEAAREGLLAAVRDERGADAWYPTRARSVGGPEARPPLPRLPEGK
jgi:hypothetical protein